jgi:hypothetical protein
MTRGKGFVSQGKAWLEDDDPHAFSLCCAVSPYYEESYKRDKKASQVGSSNELVLYSFAMLSRSDFSSSSPISSSLIANNVQGVAVAVLASKCAAQSKLPRSYTRAVHAYVLRCQAVGWRVANTRSVPKAHDEERMMYEIT